MESVWSTWSLFATEAMRTDELVMSNYWVKPSAGGALAFSLRPSLARRGLPMRSADNREGSRPREGLAPFVVGGFVLAAQGMAALCHQPVRG